MGPMGITIITWIYDSTMSYFQVSLPLNLDNHLEQLIKSANLRKLIGLLCLNTRGSPLIPCRGGPPFPLSAIQRLDPRSFVASPTVRRKIHGDKGGHVVIDLRGCIVGPSGVPRFPGIQGT